jgi:hypothetical protein
MSQVWLLSSHFTAARIHLRGGYPSRRARSLLLANGHEMPNREQEGVMKAPTPYLKPLSISTMALLVTMVAGYLMSERASAQPTPPSPPSVLVAIQEIQQTIVTLQNSVDALQASVDALGAPSQVNFRWTPPVDAAGDSMECIAVNITDVERTIQIELKTRDGVNETEATVDVAPGKHGRAIVADRFGQFHCKFTVINGTRADIRAALLGFGAGHSFQIPAE